MSFTFWLGTHRPSWLRREDVSVPLFVSHVTLSCYKRALPVATSEWACDSGSFSEVSRCGAESYPDGHRPYVVALRRYRDEIGQLAWAAPQDWMCEPWMTVKTGLSVAEHQRRTVRNFLAIRAEAPDLPVIPVLQGWKPSDYLECVELYAREGVDLAAESLVGLGSVCRRQHTGGILGLVFNLRLAGIRLHGFGLKTNGLPQLATYLNSADSMAWSFDARRRKDPETGERGAPLPECRTEYAGGRGHKGSCANCPRYAVRWRGDVIASADRSPDDLWSAT